jgi:DHA1 family bicyclomycin/chloramphenicol resistance-like MFS transporter
MTSFSTKDRTVARNIPCCSLKTFTRPSSGPPTIQWAGVLRERSRFLPVLLTAIVGLGALSIDMFLPSLPAMTLAFGSDAATAQLTVTLFLAGLATAQLFWGPLSDRLGRRRVLLTGLAVYAAAGTACAFAPRACTTLPAPSMSLLIAARVVQALGAGSGPVIARAVVRDLYESERAARVLAAMGTAQALTPILAPMLGGWVHVLAGWRAVFVVLGAFGAAFLVTAWRIVPETNVYAGARGAGKGGGLAALLRHPRYAAYVAAAALMFSGQFAFITGSSFALITILGVSPTVYGLCFGAVAVGLMAGNFVSVRFGPRLGIDTMIAGGTMIGAAAGVVMSALAWAGVASVATVIAPMFCYAFGLGWVLPNAMAGAIGPFPRMAGLAAAGAGFVQLTGSALYAIAVSHTYDGTLRPMTTAVATAAVAALVTFRLLRRGRVVLDSTERRRP